MESLSTELTATFSEADNLALSRPDCVWDCATQRLDFIGRMEVPAAVENQELSCQDVVSSREGSEQVTVWCAIHYLLDLLLVVIYLLCEQDKVIQDSILQPDFGSDDGLRDLRYRLFHNVMEILFGVFPVDLAISQQLLNTCCRKGFQLSKSVNSSKELQSRFVCYATEHIQNLGEVFLESADQLVREPDFLLDKPISVLQQETEFPDCLIRNADASKAFVMFPYVISYKLSISLIRLGFRSYPAFSVSCYGLWVSQQDGEFPLDEKVHQPGAWILKSHSTVLAAYFMLLEFTQEGRESMVVKVKSVS